MQGCDEKSHRQIEQRKNSPVLWISLAASFALVVMAILLVANPMPTEKGINTNSTASDAISVASTVQVQSTLTPTQTPTPPSQEENLPAVSPEVAVYPTVSETDVPLESDLFRREAMACVTVLNECYAASFTAQWDKNAPLCAGFLNETYHSSYPDILFPVQELDQYCDDYYLDRALTDYYLVTNYQTMTQLNDVLLQYLSQDVIDRQVLTSNFIEYENALYLVRGATGYGACHIDVESFHAVKYENNRYVATVDTLWFDEWTESLHLTFEYIDGKLILQEVTDTVI